MQIYAVTNRHHFVHRYVGNQQDAKAMQKALKKELANDIQLGNCIIGDEKYINIRPVDIPVDKAGLLNWLNTHSV